MWNSIGMLSLLGCVALFIWAVVAVIRKNGKAKKIFMGSGACFVLMIVGAVNAGPEKPLNVPVSTPAGAKAPSADQTSVVAPEQGTQQGGSSADENREDDADTDTTIIVPYKSAKPTVTPSPTVTPKPTAKISPSPSASPTVKPAATNTSKPTASPTSKPGTTLSPKPASSSSPKPTASASPKPTTAPKPTPQPETAKPTPTPAAKPSTPSPPSTPKPTPKTSKG
ncbi:hypothetical protein P4H65_05760 [Paenibacillus chitinolyticus]|uniref:hypothetical protein n=1 Tax=Paenibacillus chitinolyticus TaxID=79263 RepID=UPI002DBFBF04|nr:hypothetical protein [Paenibacillus chitinolyticus]MEC0245300.1 hypothetical protein [Paenibacillus chitinolyticus]